MRFSPISVVLVQWKVRFCVFKKKIKDQSINNAGLFSEPSLIIFIKGATNSDHVCMYLYMYVLLYDILN